MFHKLWETFLNLNTFIRFIIITIPLIIIAIPAIVAGYPLFPQPASVARPSLPVVLQRQHFFGGFSINTPARAADAAADGLQVSLLYGQPAPLGSALEQTYKKLGMAEIDGYIASNLYYHECHREKTVKIHSGSQFCSRDVHPNLTEDILLSNIATHLQDVQKNYPLVKAYWVLDDQPGWDGTYEKDLLAKIHTLIQQYTPGRPAICGFGGFINANAPGHFLLDRITTFTPQGCDIVGLYIYSNSQPTNKPLPPSDAFDWSMSTVLPQMLSALKQQGWDPQKQPLIGIPQAWGGPRADLKNTFYEIIPSAENMETQALSFCKAGAIGIIYWAWASSGNFLSPMTSSVMKEGVRKSVAACQGYWHDIHP